MEDACELGDVELGLRAEHVPGGIKLIWKRKTEKEPGHTTERSRSSRRRT